MKTIWIALGMAAVLFLYGYVLSTAGHDHSTHAASGHTEEHRHDHGDHHHE